MTSSVSSSSNAIVLCSICRDPLHIKKTKGTDVCMHIFHKACLDRWREERGSCPECREPLTKRSVRRFKIPSRKKGQGPTHAELARIGMQANSPHLVDELVRDLNELVNCMEVYTAIPAEILNTS
jgi:hypothetical protein